MSLFTRRQRIVRAEITVADGKMGLKEKTNTARVERRGLCWNEFLCVRKM
jgi:hypothetical protein